ncbi:unnamed protein product [Bemisia tabaci]|uniref:Rho-GAP domain-containing protein n=2 Tax=Bemisia tabaci TaxID=7038 RepID=A0A9P0AKZ3_BEMTA|nr:unnamed protein product [Bemisia tabaci]
MRRPTFCSNSVGVQAPRSPSAASETPAAPASEREPPQEGRISRVRKMLANSLHRRSGTVKTFKVPLRELPVTPDGVPLIVDKLCTFLQQYGLDIEGLFRLSGGNPKLVEQLKIWIDRTGDVCLEACGDITSVACLLKVWLRDLPEPLVPPETTADLVRQYYKYQDDEVKELREGVRKAFSTLPCVNQKTFQAILRLLHCYVEKQFSCAMNNDVMNLARVFSPLLLCAEFYGISTPETDAIMAKLIVDCNHIFSDCNRFIMCGSTSEIKPVSVLTEITRLTNQRKRKDVPLCQAVDRKFVRSNSEERMADGEGRSRKMEGIRRVSSSEDFRNTIGRSYANIKASQLMELIAESAPTIVEKAIAGVLHEQNSDEGHQMELDPPHLKKKDTESVENVENNPPECVPAAVAAPRPMINLDGNENELRRACERLAPAKRTRRPRKVKSRFSYDSDDSKSVSSEESKSVPGSDEQLCRTAPLSDDESASTSVSQSSSCSEFQVLQSDQSPGDAVEATPNPDDGMPSLQQCINFSEPLSATAEWHTSNNNIMGGESKLASPRNDLIVSKRTFTPSPGQTNLLTDRETHITQLNKQIHSLKKKLQRYKEGFEREFGYPPSVADKMANPDTKHMINQLNKLRKDLKIYKEDGYTGVPTQVVHQSNGLVSTYAIKEKAVKEMEMKLEEKRIAASRPHCLEELSHEQVLEEKTAVQKALLHLENIFGRPNDKEERDLFRPLYDRYRSLKRMLIKTAPSKLKESVTELATIHEHETMEFAGGSGQTTASAPAQPVPVKSPSNTTTDLLKAEQFHSLSFPELVEQQKTVKEDKKRLRRCLKEFEEEFLATTGRKLQKEDRLPMEQIYNQYKNTKAKLRLLDALVAKAR